MASKTALLKKKWKEENPQKFDDYLQRERERSRARRAEKKARWLAGPHTRELEQEREKERLKANERSRLRYYKKKLDLSGCRETRSTALPPAVPARQKRPKDMTPEEFRLHRKRLRAESRGRQSAQKKRRLREKDREYRRLQRQEATSSLLHSIPAPSHPLPDGGPSVPATPLMPSSPPVAEPPLPTTPPGSPSQIAHAIIRTPSPRRLPKILYNMTSAIKTTLRKKVSAKMYARVVRNLATPRTPEKKKALHRIGFLALPPHQQQRKTGASKRSSSRKIRKSPVKPFTAARQARTALESKIRAFFIRNDVSRPLPHKRYATKAGPTYIMNVTLRGAYRQFRVEYPNLKVGYTRFCRLRPRSVRKLGSVGVETCLCMYCLNVRYKLDALNRTLSRSGIIYQFPSETRLLDLLCCPKPMNSSWPKADCISGTCPGCKDSLRHFLDKCQTILQQPVSWTHWGRPKDAGLTKIDVFASKGTVKDLLDEFRGNLDRPTKTTTFRRHLFTAYWQFQQFRYLKNTLLEDEALMVMDFAENRKASYNAEVKSAHFGKKQITLHPIVLYFRTAQGHLARHSLMYLSEDISHDYHLVHHFTLAALEYAKQQVHLKRAFLFSDGCAAQYKGKGSFADLSLLSGLSVQRIYYGSEHGKGEADGETGVLSQALARAVQGGQVNISTARDLYEWAKATMSKDSELFARKFFLVDQEEVSRDRPETDIQTVPGTRQFHQVERVADYIIRCRKLACFCSGCRAEIPACCVNSSYVGLFGTFRLKGSWPNALDTAFVNAADETEDEDGTTSDVPPARVPQAGQYIFLTHKVGKKELRYAAMVEDSDGRDLVVSYMKCHGAYYTFPAIEDKSSLSLDDPDLVSCQIVSPPVMMNRGKYQFQE